MGVKPNVLILFTDQQRHDTLHYAGYSHMITPNMDRLAAEGCLYTHAYTTNPVCMAARHDLLTGLPAKAHGYYANQKQPIKDYSIPSIARIFSENQYRTAAIGKMHFYPQRMHHGYNELFLMEEIPNRKQDDQYAQFLEASGLGHLQNVHGIRPHLYHIPQNSQMDDAHHANCWVADRTIQWLENNDEEPFFLFCSWIHPHPPWALPEKYQSLYSKRDIPEPVPVSRSYPFPEEPNEWYGDFDSSEDKRKIREMYFSCITHVDLQIGRVLDYLERKGQLDNTLIIFTSDHGEMLQDKGFYEKQLPYEGSVRIPFIMRYPEKIPKGSQSSRFVDLFDILPSCLDICGLDYPGEKFELPGESLFAKQPERDRSHQMVTYGNGGSRWLVNRDDRYKYIYWYNQGTEEFYDLQDDPGETDNLIGNGRLPREAYSRLKQQAIRYEERWGPEGAVVNGSLIPRNGKRLHPNQSSKFPLWANNQTQRMDKRSPEVRGARFLTEIEYAISAEINSGKCLQEVFNHPEWKDSFMENWSSYGTGAEICKRLFKA